jgi:hypothetical protein
MQKQLERANTFKALHVPGRPLILFNIWDAGSAKAVAAGGAKALATGSWSVAAANGFPDGEQIPLDLCIANLRRIVDAVDLPVSLDLESGYGADPAAVGETFARAVQAGAIGCNIEDSFPDSGSLRETADQVARLRAARAAADGLGVPAFLNARTDVFFQAGPDRHGGGSPRAGPRLRGRRRGRPVRARRGERAPDRPSGRRLAPAGEHHGGRGHASGREAGGTRRRPHQPWAGSVPPGHASLGGGREGGVGLSRL